MSTYRVRLTVEYLVEHDHPQNAQEQANVFAEKARKMVETADETADEVHAYAIAVGQET